MSAEERLVTVLVTLSVPQEPDPDDPAALVAIAAESTALQVVHTVGVEGICPSGAPLWFAYGKPAPCWFCRSLRAPLCYVTWPQARWRFPGEHWPRTPLTSNTSRADEAPASPTN